MKTRVKMLKVKVKSLAAEARIIRREEKRAKGGSVLQQELHLHRVRDVRSEQRAALLAYAFLRGRSLAACEPKCRPEPDWARNDRWARVLKLVEKFGPLQPTETKVELAARFAAWRQAAAV